MIYFGQLTPEEIDLKWPECLEILKEAFRFRVHTYGPEEFEELVKNGSYQLWVAANEKIIGCVVTVLEQGSRTKICNIMALAGQDLPIWVDQMNNVLTDFANANGCYAIEAVTRAGFSKFVPDFKEDGRVYVKLLGDKNV